MSTVTIMIIFNVFCQVTGNSGAVRTFCCTHLPFSNEYCSPLSQFDPPHLKILIPYIPGKFVKVWMDRPITKAYSTGQEKNCTSMVLDTKYTVFAL